MAIKVRKKCRRQARAGVALVMAAVGALGVATVPGPGAWAQDGETDTADAPRLQRDADAVRDTGASGLVVRTEDGAGRVRQAWSGVADLDEGGRIPFDAYYRIGSDTKTFVAVVALQLVSEGTLRLDDTVEKWLPGMVAGHGNDGSRITVRDLLQHTSGLADYTDVLFGDPADLTPERFRSQRFTARTPEQQVALAMSRPPGLAAGGRRVEEA
ncbi:serine hydrolase domain-containing protein [Streptomyces sp. NPDC052079]|uniref:serine hydrolase domain-containing protein n=1 Tax=Streptomyces sp. NPDC052079 TaxID=3155526 RepID=UPI003415E3E1